METLGKRCILVRLKEEDHELDEMLDTLKYRVVTCVTQKRRHPDTRYYVGPGKLDEIKKMMEPLDVDRVVMDGVLTPVQHHNLEHELKKNVRDRVWLVLEIFEKNATSREAKLQVDLARMQYMSPFIREWIHKARKGEHPGFMGGGEYGLDDYYLFIKRKRKTIIEQLKKSELHGIEEKEALKEKGWLVIGIAGYTNAGKSTIHDALCKSSVEISPFMFTTLQPKSSAVTIWNAKIVIEDTIGFVEGLPHDVIEGFRVTLDRLRMADIVLLIIDASDSDKEMERKTRVSWDILKNNEISCICPILNKVDLISSDHQITSQKIIRDITDREPIFVSAMKRTNIDVILEKILKQAKDVSQMMFSVSQSVKPEILNLALENMIMYKIDTIDDKIEIDCFCRSSSKSKIAAIFERNEGTNDSR